MSWWEYENLESEHPYDWEPATRGNHPDDQIDFHLDLGAGTLKKGRLTLDRHGDVDIKIDLDTMTMFGSKGPMVQTGKSLPFPDESIHSIISHHCLEHIGDGFMRLMDECYRVLRPSGIFRIVVPLFPSISAVQDPDHKRYFCAETFESFCHHAPPEVPFWSCAFAEPYTKCRFILKSKDMTPPQTFRHDQNVDIDKLFEKGREIRVSLQKPAP